MATPNFTQCALDFQNSIELYGNYVYTGPVQGILKHTDLPLITVQGCRELCGTGNVYYEWADIASTISTWILPILGLLLQCPFDSNDFRNTLYAIARWMGSPVASLAYTLWNIKIASKSAMMVDMATKYEETPPEGSQYSQIRDSLYILSMMNQYTIKQRMPSQEAERLLRIALFSDSLQLEAVEGQFNTIVSRRRELAKVIRDGRKKGIVPVFVSQTWFLFSLAITIESAFGNIGSNATAHNLALGLLMIYFPVLILCFIVDRNPTNPDSVCADLNRLMDGAKKSLLNPQLRDAYMRETSRTMKDFDWTHLLGDEHYFEGDFFVKFAGQGRVRFHYGVAHPILAGIEESFVAQYGRDWLRDAEGARALLVRGPEKLHGLHSFDFRGTWQVLSSIVIVCGSALGAFIISFFTPTVGLGCRSGGYVVFNIIAVGSFAIEGLIWWLVPEGIVPEKDIITRVFTGLDRQLSHEEAGRWKKVFRSPVRTLLQGWKSLTRRDRWEVLVLRVFEVGNTGWLAYINMAQVVGSYQNCDCMGSTWGPGGGYIDFQDYNYYLSEGVTYYWGFGTGLSCMVLTVSFAFIVVEWCTQSHLSTGEYDNAQAGLRRTRAWKKYTYYIRRGPDIIIDWFKILWHEIGRRPEHAKRIRRSLVWSSHTKPNFEIKDLTPVRTGRKEPKYTWSGLSYDSERPTLMGQGTGLSEGEIEHCLSPVGIVGLNPWAAMAEGGRERDRGPNGVIRALPEGQRPKWHGFGWR